MKAIRWIITLAYAGFIFYLSSREWGGPELFPHADKVIHLAMYAILAALCLWSIRATELRGRGRLPIALAALLAVAYGASDELHQLYVPGRTASLADLAADAVGAAIGVAAAALLAKRMRRER